MTERMLHARKLEHMAYHDALLDIPNRQAALKKLQHQLKDGEKCAIVLLDICDFKLFNETFGHAKGNLLLKEVSRAIAAFVPEASLYRSGGDEFLILLPGTEGPQAQELAGAIRASFERVLVIEGLEYTCNVDIGISVSPQHGTTPSALITHAELALGEARKEGRGVYLFSKQLDQVLSRKRLLQVLIRSALANDDFRGPFPAAFRD
ncbi:MAG: GGDEF domain-containing protein [Bilophila sp.]